IPSRYRVRDSVMVTPRWAGPRRAVPRPAVVVEGESHMVRITDGLTAGLDGHATVTGRAVGGLNAWEAAYAAGAVSPILVTVPDIPASGTVTCLAEGMLATSESTPLTLVRTGVLHATTASGVVQIPGTLQRVADGEQGLAWRFTSASTT